MLALPRNPERSLHRVENTTEPTAAILWDDVSHRLREALNETTYTTWFGDAGAGELGDARARDQHVVSPGWHGVRYLAPGLP